MDSDNPDRLRKLNPSSVVTLVSNFRDNPEAWSDIECKGIAAYLLQGTDDGMITQLAENLQELQLAEPMLWNHLTNFAHKYIIDSEMDYWGDVAEAARASYDARFDGKQH